MARPFLVSRASFLFRQTRVPVPLRTESRTARKTWHSISVSDAEGSSDIMAGDLVLMTVTDQDARLEGKLRHDLATDYAQRIGSSLIALRKEYSAKSLILGGVYAVIATAVLLLIFRLMGFIFPKFYGRLDSWRGTIIPSLRIQKFEILPADRIADFFIGIARLFRFAVVLLVLYFYASLVLGFFPWTGGYARILVGYIVEPLRIIGKTVLSYLPTFFFRRHRARSSLCDQTDAHHLPGDWQEDHRYLRLSSRLGSSDLQDHSLSDSGHHRDCGVSLSAGGKVAGFPGNLDFSRGTFLPGLNLGGGQYISAAVWRNCSASSVGPRGCPKSRGGGPLAHMQRRAERNMRAGGFGILITRSLVDELIYSERGNEVVLIKYLQN